MGRKIFFLGIGFLISAINAASITTYDDEFDKAVAQRAAKIYTIINRSKVFDFCEPGTAVTTKSAMWDVYEQDVSDSGDEPVMVYNLNLKENYKISEALKNLFTKGGTFECRIIFSFVQQLLVNYFLSDKLHDFLHPILLRGEKSIDKTLFLLIKGYGIPTKPGQFGYIANISYYNTIHPKGCAAGENVFYVGEDENGDALFYGFGPLFKTGPKTKNEIFDYFYEQTLLPPVWDGDINSGLYDFLQGMQNTYASSRKFWDKKREIAQLEYPILCFDRAKLMEFIELG